MGRTSYSFSAMLTELAHKPIYRYDKLDLTEQDIDGVLPGGLQNHRFNSGTDDIIAVTANIETEALTNRDFTPLDANSVPLITLNGESSITLEVIHEKYIESGATSNQNSTVSIDSSNIDSNTPGTYTVYYTAINKLGGSNSLTRTVIYQDTTAPVIKLSGERKVYHERFGGYTDKGATADTGESVTIDSSNVDVNTVGSYTVYYSATDASGNEGNTYRTVIVRDTTGPVITLVGANPLEIAQGKPYTEPGATADGGETVTLDKTELDVDNIGSYTVYYDAVDDVGNKTRVSRTVVVVDGCPEILQLTKIGDSIVGGYNDRIGRPNTISINDDATILALSSTRRDYVKVYSFGSNTWSQIGSTITMPSEFSDEDLFGDRIKLTPNGQHLLVQSVRNDLKNTVVRIYRNINNEWFQKGTTIDYYHGGRAIDSHFSFMTNDTEYIYVIDQNIHTKPVEFYYDSSTVAYVNNGVWEEGILKEHTFTSGRFPWDFQTNGLIEGSHLYPSFGYSGNMLLNPPVGKEDGLRVWMIDDDDFYTEFEIPTQAGNGFGKTFSFSSDMRRVAASVYGTSNAGAVHILDFGSNVEQSWSNSLTQTIEGEAADDLFGGGGISMSSDGEFLAVSSILTDSGNGKVYIYKYDTSTNTYASFSTHSPPSGTTKYGMSLVMSADGNSFATGSRFDASGDQNGFIDVYKGNCDDVTAPVITLTGNNPYYSELYESYVDPGALADTLETVVVDSANVDINTLGSYTVYYTATDSSNNIGSNTRTIIVQDTTPPVVTLTGNNTVFLEHNIDTYTDLGATADTGETVVVDSANVDANTLGTYTGYYTATDDSNNIGSNTRTVITRDTIAPFITLTGNNTVFLEHNIDTYTDLGATADTGETVVVDSANVDSNTLGTYTVYYTATDISNNEGSNTRTVITRDTIAPFITLTGDANLTINQDSTYTDLGATADTGETVIIDSANVNTNVVGAYTVYYTATDSSNNIGSNTRNIVVNSVGVGEAPIITVGGDDPVYFETNIASTSLFTDLTANVSADGGETITADYGFRIKQPYEKILMLQETSSMFEGTYMAIQSKGPYDLYGVGLGARIDTVDYEVSLNRGNSYYLTTIGNAFVRSNTDFILTSSNTATDMSEEGILANILTNNVQYLSNTTMIITIDDDTPDEFWMYDKYNKNLSDGMVGRFTPQGSGYVEDSDTFRYSNVNSNLDGTYTITYSATNEYGTNTATRSVVVIDTLAPNVFYYGDQTITVDIADYANATAEDITITANTSGGGFFADLSNGALTYNNAIVVEQQLGGEGTPANPIYMDVSDWNYRGAGAPNYKLKRGKTYYIYLGDNAQEIKNFSVISTTKTTNTEYDDKGSKTDYNASKLGFLWTVRHDTPSQLWLRSTVYHYMQAYHLELGIEDDDIAYTTSNDIVSNAAGTYTITYSATDSSNNIGSNTRTLVLTDSTPVAGIPIITVGGDDPVYFEKNVDSSSLFTDLTADVSADGGETIIADYGFKIEQPVHKILELHHDNGKMGIKARRFGAHQYEIKSFSYMYDLHTDSKYMSFYRGNTYYFSTGGNAFVQSNTDFILTSSDITTAGLTQESILANTLTNNVQYLSNTTMIFNVDDDTPDNFWIYDKHNSYFLDPSSTYALRGRLRAVFSGFSPNPGEGFRYSNVNSNLEGTYTITYSATNEHGTNTATRSVIVRDTSPPGIFYYGDQTITVGASDYVSAAAEDITITANTSGGGFFAEVSNGALTYNNAIVMDHPDTKGLPSNPIYMDVSDVSYRGKSIANYHFVRGKTYYVYLGNGILRTQEHISTSRERIRSYDDKGSKADYDASKLGFLWTVRHDAPTDLWLRSDTHPYNSGTHYLTIKTVDDDSTYTVSNNIVIGTPGTYTITYSATDSSNNSTSNTRTIVLT